MANTSPSGIDSARPEVSDVISPEATCGRAVPVTVLPSPAAIQPLDPNEYEPV
jgi:hypothetical protein